MPPVLALLTPTGPVPLEETAAPAAKITLYESEEMLQCLLDTMDIVPPEQEEELVARIGEAMVTAVEKRDRMGKFLAHMDAQIAFAESEIKRLEARKATFQRVVEKVEGYLVRIIQARGKDAKGKWQKLEGRSVTFAIRKLPASVAIDDESAVPSSCRRSVVKLPAALWEEVLDNIDVDLAGRVLDGARRSDEVSKTAVKAAIDGGAAIAGAHLVTDAVKLVRG